MESKIRISEIKASISDPDRIRKILIDESADFKGVDHQIDTYFDVANSRLKLRQGKIENSLIHYRRIEQKGLKDSHVDLLKLDPKQAMDLKLILEKVHGVKVIVSKKREIYFIDNVKFHVDLVEGLGNYFEIEAINTNGQSIELLQQQCTEYCNLFEISDDQYIEFSYSDLILNKAS